jgi:diadenylate cyclase
LRGQSPQAREEPAKTDEFVILAHSLAAIRGTLKVSKKSRLAIADPSLWHPTCLLRPQGTSFWKVALLKMFGLQDSSHRLDFTPIVQPSPHTRTRPAQPVLHDSQKLFAGIVRSAVAVAREAEAEAVIIVSDVSIDWDVVRKLCPPLKIIFASINAALLAEARQIGISAIEIEIADTTVHEQLSQAVLDSVADELVSQGSAVVALYSAIERDTIDTVSVFQLNERLGRLTARDLKRLETKLPLETLKVVVDLAVEIGQEGREGKPTGTMFVVGDHRKVLEQSKPAGWDAAKGYTRKERSLFDPRVREIIKEVSQMDGAFIVASDGTIESASRIIDTAPVELSLSHGLGSRHFAAAAITKNTRAIAVVVSQSSGTVRIFQDGQIVLRIEPFRRPMTWRETASAEAAETHLEDFED